MPRSSFALLAAAVLGWVAVILASRVVLLRTGMDPWIFTVAQFITGGLVLLGAGGWRGPGIDALRRWTTWGYGVLRMITAGAMTAALLHVTAAQASFLGAINVPIASLSVAVMSGRLPIAAEMIGHAVLLSGVIWMAFQLDGGLENPAILLILLSELAVVCASLIIERDPLNRAKTWRSNVRFTGATMLATSVVMAGALLLMHYTGGVQARPSVAILSPEPWVWGLVFGVLLRGPSLLLSFRAIDAAGTERYMLALAFLPLALFAAELLLQDLLPAEARFQVTALEAVSWVMISSGALSILLVRWRCRRESIPLCARARRIDRVSPGAPKG